MTTYNTYDVILNGYECDRSNGEHTSAIEFAGGFVWSECETSEQTIAYADYIDTVDGIGVYYDYGADYYFFTDETEYESCGAHKGKCKNERDKACGAIECNY